MKWLATLLIVLSFAQAQTAFAAKESKSICKELDETIDGSIKNIALTLAQGEVIDKGVSQQTARLLSANNYLQVIQISLTLQAQNKCAIRKSVINPMNYSFAAMKCLSAAIVNKEENADELCDIKNWKGDDK